MDNVTYVTINQGLNSWRDMHCMSMCRHHIMANSTFSWWGAYLSTAKDKKVYVPERWNLECEDDYEIYPKEWVKVPVK